MPLLMAIVVELARPPPSCRRPGSPYVQGDDDGVVEVAGDGDKVGDEVGGHQQLGDQGGQDELLAAGNAGVGEQPLEEDDAVGHERGCCSCVFAAAGEDQDGDKDRVEGRRDQGGQGDGLPESQFEGDCSASCPRHPTHQRAVRSNSPPIGAGSEQRALL